MDGSVYKASIATIVVVGIVGLAHAQAAQDSDPVVDPMRPPSHAPAPRVSNTREGPRWSLSAILVSPERRLVMINNRLVGVGGIIDGARVKSIHSNSVELELGGESVFLRPGTRNVRQSIE